MSKRRERVLPSSLSPCDRRLVEAFQAMPPDGQAKFLRLIRVLERAERRGDEFTIKRLCKIPRHLGIDYILTEMERTPV